MNPFVITKKTSGFCRKFYNEFDYRLLESAVLGRLDHLLVGEGIRPVLDGGASNA